MINKRAVNLHHNHIIKDFDTNYKAAAKYKKHFIAQENLIAFNSDCKSTSLQKFHAEPGNQPKFTPLNQSITKIQDIRI